MWWNCNSNDGAGVNRNVDGTSEFPIAARPRGTGSVGTCAMWRYCVNNVFTIRINTINHGKKRASMKSTLQYRLALLGSILGLFGCSAPTTGLTADGLRPCPDRPNCVTSQNGDVRHAVAPIPYTGDRASARARMGRIVADQPGATIVAATDDYLHAEFRTRTLRFVDDVEFWFPVDRSLIHVRSASRVGYSDLGVNRRRVERLRALFTGNNRQNEGDRL